MKIKFPLLLLKGDTMLTVYKNRKSGKHFIFINEIDADKGLFINPESREIELSFNLFKEDSYLWSVTDNGLAKTTPLEAYPRQGRYGQGVINLRLPKDATEVVSVVVGHPKSDLFVKTATGLVRQMKLGSAVTGNRPIKPRPIIRIGERNRVTGVAALRMRPEMSGETKTIE